MFQNADGIPQPLDFGFMDDGLVSFEVWPPSPIWDFGAMGVELGQRAGEELEADEWGDWEEHEEEYEEDDEDDEEFDDEEEEEEDAEDEEEDTEQDDTLDFGLEMMFKDEQDLHDKRHPTIQLTGSGTSGMLQCSIAIHKNPFSILEEADKE